MARRLTPVTVARSRAIAGWLSISFVVPFALLLVLYALSVPLGQGYFRYRYSPVREMRSVRALAMLPVMGMACAGVWLLARRAASARRAGAAVMVLAMIAAGVWGWLGPPEPLTQQMFNLTSPSSDGAFLLEAGKVTSLPQYLRDFPRMVGRETPQTLSGTRVLSNPPGMTAFTYVVLAYTSPPPGQVGWIERVLVEREGMEPQQLSLIGATVRLSISLCIAWVAAGFAAYGLGRVFLSPAGAAVFAVIVTFNPCTVSFVPGKDPAQLFTINLMLWAWLAGWKRGHPEYSAPGDITGRAMNGGIFWMSPFLSGAMLVIGSTVGLIHIWVAVAALAAMLWQDRPRWREIMLHNIVPAVVGGAVVIVVAWVVLGWNIPLTLWATARRWSEIQKTFQMNRAVWYLIGLPIFLLFLSPGLWTLAGMNLRRARMAFGARLVLCTVAVMLLIYLVMGVTYELPRLWVAFLPPLTLGLAVNWPVLRARGEHPRVAKALALIVLVQVFFTTFHWTFFDAREAEYRLTSKRFYQ